MINLAEELRTFAWNLFCQNTQFCEEARIRRCISTAYYAVFRLICDEGLDLLSPQSRMDYYRKFGHNEMEEVCRLLKQNDIHGDNFLINFPVLLDTDAKRKDLFHPNPEIKILAEAFCELYNSRISADYDMTKDIIAFADVDMVMDSMYSFFEKWETMKKDNPQTLKTFVMLLLFGKKKAKMVSDLFKTHPI